MDRFTGSSHWRKIACLSILICGITLLTYFPVRADLIHTPKADVEGRVLEDSAQVLVVETVAGEYVVVRKNQILSVTKEPPEDFYYRKAKFYEAKGEDDRAMIYYIEAINRNPNHAGSRESLEAIQYKKKKAQWDEGLQQAQLHIANKEFRKAIDTYQEILDLQPDEETARNIMDRMSKAYAGLAFLFYDHCYDEGAIRELARAEELNPENAEIYYVLAKIHESAQQYDLARLEYERAIELNPGHTSARDKLMSLIERTRARVIQ